MSLSHPVISARLTSDISEFTIVHFAWMGQFTALKTPEEYRHFSKTDGTGSQGLLSVNIICVLTDEFQLASVKLVFVYS